MYVKSMENGESLNTKREQTERRMRGSSMEEKSGTDKNYHPTKRIICDCCKRDITHSGMIVWIGGTPFCYLCSEKRVRRKNEKTQHR